MEEELIPLLSDAKQNILDLEIDAAETAGNPNPAFNMVWHRLKEMEDYLKDYCHEQD